MPVARRRQFGELERAIFEVLWGPEATPRDPDVWLSVREIQAGLDHSRESAYTTVMTVLDRLAAKDLVDRRKEGRAYRYRAVHSRQQTTVELMHSVLGEFSTEGRDTALLAFVQGATDEDRAALRAALAQLDAS